MIRAMHGWMAFPFRLAIAIAVAWVLSMSFSGSETKLDFSFLSQPETESVIEPTSRPEVASAPAQPMSFASKIGISASAALVLYVWIAYEWVGFSRFEKAMGRLKKMGALVQFDFDINQPFWLYFCRAGATVDLSRRQVNPEHFQLLKQMRNVCTLRLAHAKVPNDFVKRLRKLKKLKRVDVAGLVLTDAERRELAHRMVR